MGCDGQLLRKRPIRVTKAVKVPAHLKDLGKAQPGKKPIGRDASERKSPAGRIAIHRPLCLLHSVLVYPVVPDTCWTASVFQLAATVSFQYVHALSENALQGPSKAGQAAKQLLPYSASQSLRRTGRASRPRAPRRQWLQLLPKVQGLANGLLRANEKLQRNDPLLSCASSVVLPSNCCLACDLWKFEGAVVSILSYVSTL